MVVPGSTLSIENSCFVNNDFHKHGVVNAFNGATVESDNNFVTIDPTLGCPFIAQAESEDAAFQDGITCVAADATVCSVSDSVLTTSPPTPVATDSPTGPLDRATDAPVGGTSGGFILISTTLTIRLLTSSAAWWLFNLFVMFY
jgi:hypothetical protein